ncbi:hypothetical protein Plhal304r1_c073g0161191 [Plasmopara halstedii]
MYRSDSGVEAERKLDTLSGLCPSSGIIWATAGSMLADSMMHHVDYVAENGSTDWIFWI